MQAVIVLLTSDIHIVMENNYKELPRLSFSEAVRSNISKLTNINGRARRSELWWNFLVYFIVTWVVGMIFSSSVLLQEIVQLVLQLFIVAVTVRRLHDVGQGGWWVALAYIISIISLIYNEASGINSELTAVNLSLSDLTSALLSPVYVILSLAAFVVNIAIYVFCLIGGKPQANKYGASPKYVDE